MTKTDHFNWWILGSIVVASLLTMASILIQGTDEMSVRFLIGYSAKFSVSFFSLAFTASGIFYLFPGTFTKIWMNFRPNYGLTFMVLHTFHLIFLVWLQLDIHPVFTLAKKSSLIGGGMAYGFMYLMALTTFPRFKSMLTVKQWKLLHTVGGYWIWFIFIKTYWRNVSTQGEDYGLFIMLSVVIAIRFTHLVASKTKN